MVWLKRCKGNFLTAAIEMNTAQLTKRWPVRRLVEFVAFNSAFARCRKGTPTYHITTRFSKLKLEYFPIKKVFRNMAKFQNLFI